MFSDIDTILVDVRTHEEFEEKTIKDAISVPLENIHETLTTISAGTTKTEDGFACDKEYVVFCDTGKRSHEAYLIFKKHGFKVFNGGSLV